MAGAEAEGEKAPREAVIAEAEGRVLGLRGRRRPRLKVGSEREWRGRRTVGDEREGGAEAEGQREDRAARVGVMASASG